MLTPDDIRGKRFDKAVGGYKAEDVQAYLAQVADYVQDLEQDMADMEKKMDVLAEKLEEYREDEDSLRAALIGAQKLGDSVVRESKRKAEAVIAGAVRKAEEIAQDAQSKIDSEARELEKMRVEVAAFKTQLMKLYTQHLTLIECLPDLSREVEAPRITYTPPPVEKVTAEAGVTGVEDGSRPGEEMAAVTAAEPGEDGMSESPPSEEEARPNRLRYDTYTIKNLFDPDKPIRRE